MESHTFHSVNFFILERFIARIPLFVLVILFIFIIFFIIVVVLTKSLLQRLNCRVIGNDLCKNRQMRIEQLPSGLEDQIDRIFREVNQVTEDDDEALERVLLQIEKLSRIRLDQLHEESHPRLESLAQGLLDKFIVAAICPCDQADQHVEEI